MTGERPVTKGSIFFTKNSELFRFSFHTIEQVCVILLISIQPGRKVRNNRLLFMVLSALTDISVQEESCLAENTGKEGEIG